MILMAALVLIGINLPAYADERPVDYERLPKQAREFISQHFQSWEVMGVTQDDGEYDVFFNNGNKIEFDRKGNWKEIECKTGFIPYAVVPSAIANFVKGNYPGRDIIEAKRERKGHQVKLDNRVELKFDRNDRFIGLD